MGKGWMWRGLRSAQGGVPSRAMVRRMENEQWVGDGRGPVDRWPGPMGYEEVIGALVGSRPSDSEGSNTLFRKG